MENPNTAQINFQAQVATAGEALIDMICNPDGRFEACLGGAVYNLTRALALQEVATVYLNPLSRDRFGRQLAAGLRAAGVHLACPEPVMPVTSLAVVNVNDQGHPDYAFYRQGVADRATSAAQLTQACTQADALSVVCTGALALSPDDAGIYIPWLQNQRAAGRTIVVDANLRPSVMPDLADYRRHVMAALQYADVIKASDEDLECLELPGGNALEQAAFLLRNSTAKALALTRGSLGASLLSRTGQVYHARETTPLAVVDTVGAGDCFLAGFVAALLELQLPIYWKDGTIEPVQARKLLSRAVASASLCVMQRGCHPPSRQEVSARIAHAALDFSAQR